MLEGESKSTGQSSALAPFHADGPRGAQARWQRDQGLGPRLRLVEPMVGIALERRQWHTRDLLGGGDVHMYPEGTLLATREGACVGLPSSLSHASELQGQLADHSPGASAFRARA